MAWFLLARALIVAAVTWAAVVARPFYLSPFANAGVGLAVGVTIVVLECCLRTAEVSSLLGALVGGILGLLLARTTSAAMYWADAADGRILFLHSVVLLALPYLGVVLGARKGEWLHPARLVGLFRNSNGQKRYRVLDTSVIIDGRIADICATGFLDGILVVPQFVLKELQMVADSPDSIKRNRGRRGLDILQKIQKMSGVHVTISEVDFPDVREVDSKARS